MIPISIPVSIHEAWMSGGEPGIDDSSSILRGTAVFLETWSTLPTLCFMNEDGACYHDLPLRAFGCSSYHAPEFWRKDESPVAFDPPCPYAEIYGKDRKFLTDVIVVKGLVWPKNDILLYLCAERNKEASNLYLWPVHKMLFSSTRIFTSQRIELPNWKKNRIT